MLNQIVLVGRLAEDVKEIAEQNGRKRVSLILAVDRKYKNSEGSYDKDYINCILYDTIAATTSKHCNVGSIVGIKGRVETSKIEENGNVYMSTSVIAERVTFLGSNIKDEN